VAAPSAADVAEPDVHAGAVPYEVGGRRAGTWRPPWRRLALRQWVLTFPFPRRRRLAHDGALLGALTRIFVESVHTFYVERAAAGGAPGAKTGAVTVVQRTSSDLRLNPHLHVVFLDGAYHEDGATLAWEELGHLKTREVGEVLEHSLTGLPASRARRRSAGTPRGSPRALSSPR
jgi:hypothetical protein